MVLDAQFVEYSLIVVVGVGGAHNVPCVWSYASGLKTYSTLFPNTSYFSTFCGIYSAWYLTVPSALCSGTPVPSF